MWIGRKCILYFIGGFVIGINCTLSENLRIFTHGHGLVLQISFNPGKQT